MSDQNSASPPRPRRGNLRNSESSTLGSFSDISRKVRSSAVSARRSWSEAVELWSELGLGEADVRWRKIMQDAEDSPLAAQRLDELKAVLADSPLADNKPFLRACLRAKKYQVEKAHTLAVNYEEFGPRVGWVAPAKPVTAVSLEAELRSGFNLILPEPDLHGHVVVTQRMGLLDFKNGSSLESHQRAGYYLLHRALQREQAQRFGVALVLDFRGFGFRLFTRVGAGDLSRGIAMLQDCFPARLAVIYILHQPIWLSALVAMLGPLVNKDSLKQKVSCRRHTSSLLAQC